NGGNMKRLKGVALMAVLALLVAACGGSTGESAAPSGDEKPAGWLEALGAGEGELNLIIWPGYAERGEYEGFNWVDPFEAETGCKVNVTAMTDSNNGVQLLQSGQYDGGSFSCDASVRLMTAGDVAPINVDLLSNYAAVFSGLKNQAHNSMDGMPYGVPHGRGPNLLMWNTEVVTTAPTSWDAVWEGDSAVNGKISIYDSSIYIADAAIHLMAKRPELGITNPYQLNEEQFSAAIDLLEKQRDLGVIYWGNYADQVAGFASGDLVIGTTWQFMANVLGGDATAPKVGTVMPDEGSTGWSDTWMMATKAAHPNCMYLWMNHMMSAEANGQATVFFGEAATSEAACDYAETIVPGHCELTHASNEAYWEKIWYWATPREDCDDADPATTCKTQDDWVEAWTTLRGN
ncbi:MAG: extracellular solute-binding protein, partial [Candidatus Limnocylindrus sp.]